MNVDQVMQTSPVIPVLTVEKPEHGAPLARALVAGGLRVLEVTLRTPAAVEVMQEMSRVEGAIVGAGTALNAADVERSVKAGAQFIVSPGLTETIARAAEAAGVPLLPGVATAGDIMRGLDLGLTRFKFFPAETSGGADAVKAFSGPFAQVRFCPTGGIRQDTAHKYLSLPNVACIGGTWITPKALLDAQDWDEVQRLASEAAGLRDR
jgi:2-dehydro-3-deoxyphosphogluconate aldolase/(4S)-4-hydroxy-2-oxoglutarate aldolase